MKRSRALSIVAALLLAGCGGAAPSTPPASSSRVAPPATTAPPSAAVASPSTAPSSVPSELEGLWHTDVVTQDDMRAVLHDADLAGAIQPFFAFWKPGQTNVFTLRINRGQWSCYWSKDGGPPLDEDSGRYTISGDTVTITHDNNGTDTHRWSVDGDTLTITYVSDTMDEPVPRGEEVYQRLLYMSSPWTRGAP